MSAAPKKHAHSSTDQSALNAHLSALQLPFILENHQAYAQRAAEKANTHLDYLSELIRGEAAAKDDRRVLRCIHQAKFPVLKTSEHTVRLVGVAKATLGLELAQ